MKRNRRSNSETLEFLREKMEPDKENRSMQYEQKRNQTDLVIAILQKMLAVMKSLAEKKNQTDILLFGDDVFTEKVKLKSNNFEPK